MRCQKCGLISFDGRKTCSGCGKVAVMPEGIVGTVVDARSPAFLAQPRARDSEAAPPPAAAPAAPRQAAPVVPGNKGEGAPPPVPEPARPENPRKESFAAALATAAAAPVKNAVPPPFKEGVTEDFLGLEIASAVEDNEPAVEEEQAGSLEDILAGIDLGTDISHGGPALDDGKGLAPQDFDSLDLNLKLEKDI